MTLAELQRALRWLRVTSLSVDLAYDEAKRPTFATRAVVGEKLHEHVETTLEASVVGLLNKVSGP